MYNWTRFWCLTGESISFADDGFLYDPQSEHGATINPAARLFADIADNCCLVLLGDPGIGKSTELQQLVAETQADLARNGDSLITLDLGEYGDESRLIADLFEAPTFQNWTEGTNTLNLFLDSLDECRLQIPHVAKLISRGLERHHGKLLRMRLRISCRTADWPRFLNERLAQLWEDSAPAIYEMLPLRRCDVLDASKASGLNPEEFVQQVIERGIQPFAIKPITLQFLLEMFREKGELPLTQRELYQQGCRLLCEEMSTARQSAAQVGKFSATKRLAAAERIAAVIVFCNKGAITLSPQIANAPPEDVAISELVTTLANTNGPLSEELVRETLSTGIFTGRGDQQLNFAHRTIAEYLAASYLHHGKLATKEQLKFFLHPDDPNGRIVPQLRETAAWLASMDPTVFRLVTESDPQVLVRSDAASHTADDRSKLVDRLLYLAQRDELDSSDWSERDHYHKLSHATIARQLTPYVTDREKPV